ncbi:MAG: hypothetical protein ISR90_02630 [Candidatus Marinimicrobia bacterium]|nr:hypothetical protein [Candidatus Neomarinimicrobiota bacterium]MBL7022936.1 hypothetical protein [Candidatus Neomarinimicrobiota bacterium]MBL7108754.1 hypothetical protein [Candidatus Neomarinimicrobiota bacterium]
MKSISKIVALLILVLIGYSCVSSSMEFTTAKTTLRSERNVKEAEKWFIKALEVEPNNALIPYIMATEIYRPQKRWSKMVDMFDEALRRNPETIIEKPFMTDNRTYVKTIEDAIRVYSLEEWGKIYNSGVEHYSAGKIDRAIELFGLAMRIVPNDGNAYSTLASLHLNAGNISEASTIIEQGLSNAGDNVGVLQTAGDIAVENNMLEDAIKYYLKTIELLEKPGPVMQKLIFLYIELNDFTQAIEYSMLALKENPYDPDIYYNVGVLYQKLALNEFDPARDLFNKISNDDNRDKNALVLLFNKFAQARSYSSEAKDYFLQAKDLETEEIGSADAVREIDKMINQIDNLFIPAVRKMMDE